MKKLRRLLRRLLRWKNRITDCPRGRHAPDRRRARWSDGYWHAACRNCGVRLRRLRKREWIVFDQS